MADLRTVTQQHGTSPAAPEAYLELARVLEQQGKADEAMAAYVELRTRYVSSQASADGTVQLARLILRSKRPDRVRAARDLLAGVPARHADSPWAPHALAAKAALEAREKIKEADAALGATVPAAIATNRVLVERYPESREAEHALWHLGDAYDDLRKYDLSAAAYAQLGRQFPQTRYDAWWRAAERYDKRLKDAAAAQAAYAQVPQRSANYREAQKRARKTTPAP
jgi:TolA-binding protein